MNNPDILRQDSSPAPSALPPGSVVFVISQSEAKGKEPCTTCWKSEPTSPAATTRLIQKHLLTVARNNWSLHWTLRNPLVGASMTQNGAQSSCGSGSPLCLHDGRLQRAGLSLNSRELPTTIAFAVAAGRTMQRASYPALTDQNFRASNQKAPGWVEVFEVRKWPTWFVPDLDVRRSQSRAMTTLNQASSPDTLLKCPLPSTSSKWITSPAPIWQRCPSVVSNSILPDRPMTI
jgi:alpha-D-ribose 1-methylphosphonate 5-triphosphate synthase subunit PhnG